MHINIKTKLIVSLLLANGMLAFGIYTFATKRIDSDYLNYINRAQNEKLAPFIEAVGRQYGEFGDWQWINDRHYLWGRLIQRYVMGADPQADEPLPHPPHGMDAPPPQGDHFPPPDVGRGPLDMDMHFLIRDREKKLVIGAPAMAAEARWLPIRHDDTVVGELGVISMTQVTTHANDIFIQEQKRVIGYMVLGLMVTAIVISLALARHFQKSLSKITGGVHKLVAGDYEQTLGVDSKDEFGQLANDLNQLSRTLKENRQSRRQWIADISHELRTPVTIMQGELDAILDGVRDLNMENIASLQQEAQRLGNLIGDLHELSMSDLGALAYRKETLDFAGLLRNFIAVQKQVVFSAGLNIRVQIPQQQVQIFADSGRLEQLFMNLLQNTLRYTDMPGTLDVSLEIIGGKAVINWEDSAPGIDSEDMPRLFERLYRAEKSRSRAKGGSGLGMSICKNIVDAHGGEISLYHSRLGGLGIRITLPLAHS